MRIVLMGLAVATALLSAGIEAADAQRSSPRPWCLRTGDTGPTGGLNDCSYYTLEQCRASAGTGADSCFANPDLAWDRLEGRQTRQPPRR